MAVIGEHAWKTTGRGSFFTKNLPIFKIIYDLCKRNPERLQLLPKNYRVKSVLIVGFP
jgi:hypothetical protein